MAVSKINSFGKNRIDPLPFQGSLLEAGLEYLWVNSAKNSVGKDGSIVEKSI